MGSSRVRIRKFCALPSKPPCAVGELVQRALAVVAVRRMADVVGQAGHVDEVGIAAQPDRHAAADLRHLQRVGQPGARGLALARPDDLSLVGQPAQRRAVQHPGPVAGEIGAVFGVGARQRGTLRRFDHQALRGRTRRRVVVHGHRRTVCQDLRRTGCPACVALH